MENKKSKNIKKKSVSKTNSKQNSKQTLSKKSTKKQPIVINEFSKAKKNSKEKFKKKMHIEKNRFLRFLTKKDKNYDELMKNAKTVKPKSKNKINKSNIAENTKKIHIKNDYKISSRQFFQIPFKDVCMATEDLSVFYKGKEVIKKISCQFPKNKVIALIGKSGSGKSTFIRCINRLNDYIPNCYVSGKIYFKNENINSPKINTTSLRTNIGMVFQKPNPFSMSIYDNVTYGPRIHGVKKKEDLKKLAKHSLKRAGLYDEVKKIMNDTAVSLSGGQQQRLCIARAIALEPEVILFDEPTSALDPIAVENIEKLIKNLSKNYTIIIVTHSLRQAKRISDYIMFLKDGKLKEYNKTESIFENPKSPSTKKYLEYELKH